MPLYEYYCEPCEGAFELLRPAREASLPQPCPECDDDARRIVSHQWSAFIYRDGYARRLPDDGGYYHLGKKVKTMVTGGDGYTHPELSPRKPDPAPSIEDIERYEYQQERKIRETNPEIRARVIDDNSRKEEQVRKQMLTTRGSRAEEAAKRRALSAERTARKKLKGN
ncbi:MAG: zinc ribbon domain-containing protein [Dehalococcoidia bacterium]